MQFGSAGDVGEEVAVGDDAAHFLGEEEEGVIPPDGAADGAAEVVVAQRGNRNVVAVVEIGVGVEHIVAEELVEVPVELVGAGAGDDVDLPAGAAAEFGVVVAALHGELGDGVDAGIGEQREVRAAVHVVRAVDVPGVLRGAAAVDGEVDLVRSADGIRDADVELI